MEFIYLILGFVLHEVFHIFVAIGGFVAIKKLIKRHKCCTHEPKKVSK